MDDYIIPFKGLADEIHRFHYELDESFFEELEYSELQHGSIKVDLVLDKQERMMTLLFSMDGEVEVSCDRCLDSFMMPVQGERTLFIKYGDRYGEEDDNIIVIPRDSYQLDIKSLLYEFILLLLPYKRVHPEDNLGQGTCNPEMIQLLQRHQMTNQIDSRWDVLRDIQDKMDH